MGQYLTDFGKKVRNVDKVRFNGNVAHNMREILMLIIFMLRELINGLTVEFM